MLLMRRRFVQAVLLVLFVSKGCVAFAWWDTGHMLVAQIAYDRLSPRAKAEVDRLLAFDAIPESRTFVEAACWADDIKKKDIRAYDEWHYIDVAFSSDNTPLPPLEKAGNVQWALAQCDRILRSPKAPDSEKARMLRFLIHFVGDVHQPLHCVSRFTKLLPDGDKGGNSFLLKGGQARNLHAFWDSGAGLFGDSMARPLDANAEKTLRSLAEDVTKANPAETLAGASNITFKDWVAEGAELARTKVYATTEGEAPSEEYTKTAREACRRQVALAGYRLAALLNKIYSEEKSVR